MQGEHMNRLGTVYLMHAFEVLAVVYRTAQGVCGPALRAPLNGRTAK